MIGNRKRIFLSACAAAFAAFPAGAQALPAGPAITTTAPAQAESTLRQADLRVARTAYRLALAGAPLCPSTHPLTGLLFHHLAEYEPPDRALMIARYALDRGPGVLAVVGGSPAAKAGLVAGDVLLGVNGRPFQPPTRLAAEADRKVWRPMAEADEASLETELRQGPAELLVLRGGRELRLTLGSVPACLGRVRLAYSKQTNAFANGRYVVMTTAMLAFLRSDDELAVVLGHELSHNIFGHPSTHDEEGLLTGLGIGKPSAMWRREETADRFGLRLMAAAGYDLDAAIPFWRRYLKKYDWFPQIFRSHPSLGARQRIARDEIAAIRREGAARP
jgi:Zn-dependent protease with chaperone function